jgi:hypothetical protein
MFKSNRAILSTIAMLAIAFGMMGCGASTDPGAGKKNAVPPHNSNTKSNSSTNVQRLNIITATVIRREKWMQPVYPYTATDMISLIVQKPSGELTMLKLPADFNNVIAVVREGDVITYGVNQKNILVCLDLKVQDQIIDAQSCPAS